MNPLQGNDDCDFGRAGYVCELFVLMAVMVTAIVVVMHHLQVGFGAGRTPERLTRDDGVRQDGAEGSRG